MDTYKYDKEKCEKDKADLEADSKSSSSTTMIFCPDLTLLNIILCAMHAVNAIVCLACVAGVEDKLCCSGKVVCGYFVGLVAVIVTMQVTFF